MDNLDAMEPEDLMAFWFRHQRGRAYRDLFPAGGRGTKRAAAGLANYASNVATAKRLRRQGNIPTALDYENISERIYQGLPKWARW